MKRTNLVLNEEILEEAVRISGQKTYSRTVDLALQEIVRRHKARQFYEDLRASGAWEGDLALMRRDAPRRARKRS